MPAAIVVVAPFVASGEDLSSEHIVCPALSTLLDQAETVAATEVTKVVAYGVLRETPSGHEDAESGDFSYAVTVERVLRSYKWVEDTPLTGKFSVLTFSACPSCNREEAGALSVVPVGTRRLLLADRPSFPGLLGIPQTIKNLGLSFDAIGSSACANVKLDPEGFNAEVHAILDRR